MSTNHKKERGETFLPSGSFRRRSFTLKSSFVERIIIKLFALLVLLPFFALIGCGEQSVSKSAVSTTSPQRLISTVPSITEILFDIGVGDRLVGDSRFTAYPPEAAKIEKIGGLYDINTEKIVSLKPDLLIGLSDNDTLQKQLDFLGIESLTVDHRSIDGIVESYEIIGKRLGPKILEIALQRQAAFKEHLAAFEQNIKDVKLTRVLLCVDRSRGTGRIQNLFVSGTNPIYQDVIRLAGGVNVAAGTNLPFPNLSAEGVIHLAPDVIVEFFTGDETTATAVMNEEKLKTITQTALTEWKTLGDGVPAIKNNRIYIITEDYATIPGPRTPMLIEKLKKILDHDRSE